MIEERYELAIGRIKEILTEVTVSQEAQRNYFRKMSEFILMLQELRLELGSGRYKSLSLEELSAWNHKLYRDILPDYYSQSYANPAYAVAQLGADYGQLLSFLYAELRAGIAYAFENRTEYLVILYELFIEVYNCFEESEHPDMKGLRDIVFWYANDYCDVFVADRIQEQIDPENIFATDIITGSDLSDLRYLYQFGEYISDNELGTAKHLNSLDDETLQKMADVYTEGYRIGFINTGKDLSIKSTVNIRYILGFEKVVKKAIDNFEKMGLRPVIYRATPGVLTKRKQHRIGYFGGVPNKQYDYDHRSDEGLFLNKRFVERKLEVMKTAFEQCKELASGMAGPAVMETFGEAPFSPKQKEEAVKLTENQETLYRIFEDKASQLTNEYIRGEERSFTIIAYPIPEIGKEYSAIFDEVIKINTLDAKVYQDVQQTIIDALDQGEYVHILGKDGNRTDLYVQLYRLLDPSKQTIFENCVADVNIPVGEVFTTPVLEGTNGTLHVSKVYLNELQYRDLEIVFANGMIADYNCGNFDRESDGKKYVRDNVLHNHPTLPLGEFAIGTNTTAYMTAKKYAIEEKMPILIAEKMGPHFAVGDTCYTWSEETNIYNPDGKEIVARDNSVSIQRKEDVSKAYYHCHTDITIPYEEIGSIKVVTKTGQEVAILENGEFVLAGTEILNEPLKKDNK